MRDNAVSYQQSIQLETKLKELQAERQIIEQKRNIANREREKVVTESVSLKVGCCAGVFVQFLCFLCMCVYSCSQLRTTQFNSPLPFPSLIVVLSFFLTSHHLYTHTHTHTQCHIHSLFPPCTYIHNAHLYTPTHSSPPHTHTLKHRKSWNRSRRSGKKMPKSWWP